MSAAAVFTVTFWERHSELEAYGTLRDFEGFARASRRARDWMAQGDSFYVSIERKRVPFAAARGKYEHQVDGMCVSGGVDDFWLARIGAHGSIDAPEYTAGGSMVCFTAYSTGEEYREQSVTSRGVWI